MGAGYGDMRRFCGRWFCVRWLVMVLPNVGGSLCRVGSPEETSCVVILSTGEQLLKIISQASWTQ